MKKILLASALLAASATTQADDFAANLEEIASNSREEARAVVQALIQNPDCAAATGLYMGMFPNEFFSVAPLVVDTNPTRSAPEVERMAQAMDSTTLTRDEKLILCGIYAGKSFSSAKVATNLINEAKDN
ncbi:hypothetical protein TW86_03610 [Halomonas sp. S2151]|uniref:hypothetical protein n=1 Tax=Halomonas sp. S2151 TaxID=579478 RepID=UPI0005F9B595|nr:hypothetical protein [Halomonas sp. S2151]KJZ17358.1 hypothetical protein TW86_03610 [Halomonas sp. S2151]